MRLSYEFRHDEEKPKQRRSYRSVIRQIEDQAGKPIEDVIHELKVAHGAEAVPGLLGVTRSWLYANYGEAMDSIKYWEKKTGKSFVEVILARREEGQSMAKIAQELGVAVTTLYNYVRRNGSNKAI